MSEEFILKANLVETKVIVVIVSFEVHIVTNVKNWVVDSSATRHICGNRCVFSSYTTIGEGEEQVCMGGLQPSLVIGKGKVLLKPTLGEVLAFNDVLHMSNIHWNLELVSLLGKVRVKITFKLDKIILTKSDVFVRKGYYNHGLFMLNFSELVIDDNASTTGY